MLKLISILLFILTLQSAQARSFKPAHCEVDNFGVKTTFFEIGPSDETLQGGLDVVVHYNRIAPQLFIEVKEKLEKDLNLMSGFGSPDQIVEMRLKFGPKQCWQLPGKAWVIQCISDPSSLPRHTKIEAELTLADGRVLIHEIETRVSVVSVQRVNALFGKSERPEMSMSLHKPAQPVGHIVLASSTEKNPHGICVNY